MHQDFKKRFDHVLIEHLDVTMDMITPRARFKEDLGADWLDMAEVIVALEKEFEISIPDEEADFFTMVGDMERCVARQLHPGGTRPPLL